MSPEWQLLLGRFHPLLVHAPIGALIALVFVELTARLGREPARPPRRALATLTALSAVASAATGWLLAEEAGGASETLDWHRWLGVALAVVASVAALAAFARSATRLYAGSVTIACALAIVAGHQGGSMTHGPDFLAEPWRAVTSDKGSAAAPPAAAAAASSAPEVSWYESRIAPFFANRCERCHNETRRKGGLALHDPKALLAGGDSGVLFAHESTGSSASSELVRRLTLELEHDEHMPPSSKPQPSPEEVAEVVRWVDAGAPFDEPDPEGRAVTLAEPTEAATASVPEARASTPVDPSRVAALRGEHVHVETIDPESGGLWLDYAARADVDGAMLSAHLAGLEANVIDLSLAGTAIQDPALETLASLERLERLDLSRTSVSSTGLDALAGHETLRSLNVTGTRIDDAAVDTLRSLDGLERLFVWNTELSSDALETLARDLPLARITTGPKAPVEPLETEPPPLLSNPASPANLEPSNTLCPVSGDPVDPRFRIVHDGRVLGFCCAECPSTYWASRGDEAEGD